MNYYKEIKDKILENEAYERIKNYSKEKHRVLTYFEIGRLLNEAGKHYGESIIEKYAQSLTRDFGKKYGKRTLFRMRQFYLLFNGSKWATPEKLSTKSLYYKGDLDQKRASHNSSLQKVSSLNKRSPEMPYLKGDSNQKVSSSSPKSSLQNVPNNLHVSQKVTTPDISTIIISSFITKLTWTHFIYLITIKNKDERDYYTNTAITNHLSVRQLESRIKSKEYYRIDEKTRNKLIYQKETSIVDFVKNPIIINNKNNYSNISEKILQTIILEDLPSFLKELGNGFSFIDNEFKIKLDDRNNYIDLLLFNIEFNCYVVIELKVTELKKEHIGQIELYMNYIDKNIKKKTHDNTIGIIICKKDNEFVIEYCSDKRIISREYDLI